MFLNIIMIKYLGEEKNVSLWKKEKERKKKSLPFLLFFTPQMVKNDVFLEKASAKWDFIVESRREGKAINKKEAPISSWSAALSITHLNKSRLPY